MVLDVRDNVPVIRRFTGGGTVIVDEETLFGSLIMNVTISILLFTTLIILIRIG